jgi:putative colanic acid biosynthesis acetyltransferase WcaF
VNPNDRTFTFQQDSRYKSPRNVCELLLQTIWQYCWVLFCSWTPKPLNFWRLFWLRLFGAKLHGKPFVHPLARINTPWNLTMHDRSALGERANAYALGEIELKARCTVAQEVYLCAATHDFDHESLPLKTGKITVGEDAFLGARAFLMPGISIGAGTVIGACSVVTRDVPEWTIAAGNPCRPIRDRELINKQINSDGTNNS